MKNTKRMQTSNKEPVLKTTLSLNGILLNDLKTKTNSHCLERTGNSVNPVGTQGVS